VLHFRPDLVSFAAAILPLRIGLLSVLCGTGHEHGDEFALTVGAGLEEYRLSRVWMVTPLKSA
jgi:hypothetical protein